MPASDLVARAAAILDLCRDRGLTLATAESCTGGLIAATLTAVAGSSDVLDRGFVTYSNRAKSEVLGVPEALITRRGAISAEVARAMAEGALERSSAALTVACTGIAGPGGGSAEKPVGLVHLAVAGQGQPVLARRCAFGDVGRDEVRRLTVLAAFELLEQQIAARA